MDPDALEDGSEEALMKFEASEEPEEEDVNSSGLLTEELIDPFVESQLLANGGGAEESVGELREELHEAEDEGSPLSGYAFGLEDGEISSFFGRRSGHAVSNVWSHYQDIFEIPASVGPLGQLTRPKVQAKCRYCHKIVRGTKRVTSNFITHLKSHHKDKVVEQVVKGLSTTTSSATSLNATMSSTISSTFGLKQEANDWQQDSAHAESYAEEDVKPFAKYQKLDAAIVEAAVLHQQQPGNHTAKLNDSQLLLSSTTNGHAAADQDSPLPSSASNSIEQQNNQQSFLDSRMRSSWAFGNILSSQADGANMLNELLLPTLPDEEIEEMEAGSIDVFNMNLQEAAEAQVVIATNDMCYGNSKLKAGQAWQILKARDLQLGGQFVRELQSSGDFVVIKLSAYLKHTERMKETYKQLKAQWIEKMKNESAFGKQLPSMARSTYENNHNSHLHFAKQPRFSAPASHSAAVSSPANNNNNCFPTRSSASLNTSGTSSSSSTSSSSPWVTNISYNDRIKCPKCDARMSHYFNLRGHLLSHYDERAYLCALCKRPFKTEQGILNHQFSDHQRPRNTHMAADELHYWQNSIIKNKTLIKAVTNEYNQVVKEWKQSLMSQSPDNFTPESTAVSN